ncbi:Uncharacterized protein Adt_18326 [Abeliophyllum distichum]|uniref:Uncharacterized protein n=1 Tax=Abeliophyllum distichum TaxID=126358 RepID=A0ABD1TJ21_9LAMI
MADTQIRREVDQEAARATAVEAVQLAVQQIQQHHDDDDDDGNMPMAQFLTQAAVLDCSSIVYPAFGQHGFQFKVDLINRFSNNLQFYGKVHEKSKTHLSRFIWMCHNFQFLCVNDDAIKLRLFPYILRNGALEWMDSEPHASITT